MSRPKEELLKAVDSLFESMGDFILEAAKGRAKALTIDSIDNATEMCAALSRSGMTDKEWGIKRFAESLDAWDEKFSKMTDEEFNDYLKEE